MTAFPLSAAPVAVVGSRHGSPYGVAQFAAAVVQAGGHVLTGCASGVDRAAACAAAAAGARVTRVPALGAWPTRAPASRVVVAADHTPPALATRTRLVVQHAAAVAVFPPAGGAGALGPGSLLALRLAVRRGVPVFVAGPVAPAGVGWSAAAVAGVAGWLRLPAPTLF